MSDRYSNVASQTSATRKQREASRILREDQDRAFAEAAAFDASRREYQQSLDSFLSSQSLTDDSSFLSSSAPTNSTFSSASSVVSTPISSSLSSTFVNHPAVESSSGVEEFRVVKAEELEEEAKKEDGPTCRIVIVLPSGSRIQRILRPSSKVKSLFDFAQHSCPSPDGFRLVSTFPRKIIDDPSITLEEAGLSPSAVLHWTDS